MGNDVGGAPCSNSPWTPVYIFGVKCEANCLTALNFIDHCNRTQQQINTNMLNVFKVLHTSY